MSPRIIVFEKYMTSAHGAQMFSHENFNYAPRYRQDAKGLCRACEHVDLCSIVQDDYHDEDEQRQLASIASIKKYSSKEIYYLDWLITGHYFFQLELADLLPILEVIGGWM